MGSISCIDASPGTGKTFLTACLLMSYNKDATYIVYTNKLSDIMNNIYFNGISTTCCKFLMNLLNFNYMKVKNLWYLKGLTFEEKCKDVEKLAKNCKPIHALYILDENSVVSPFFIYFFYCLYKYHKIHVIFIGDQYQQISMNSTKHHLTSNFKLIQTFSNTYNLNVNIRQNTDVKFQHILKEFREMFTTHTSNCMDFSIKYFFYTRLKEKFHTEESFKTMYFAQYHMLIMQRLERYEKYLNKNKIKYTKSYLHQNKTNPILNINMKKFKPYLILVKGEFYIYSPNNRINYLVQLLEVKKDTLKLFNVDINREIVICRCRINTSFISEQLLLHLNSENITSVYQYPIKELTSTYHSAQGITIANSTIELNMDCHNINSFYVGLTRIKQLSQLNKLHTTDTLHLMYTHYKNDGYFYKINNFNEDFENLSFIECNSKNIFDTTNRNIKIKINNYNKLQEKVSDKNTDLMNYINKISNDYNYFKS